jgi:hypothetical protein
MDMDLAHTDQDDTVYLQHKGFRGHPQKKENHLTDPFSPVKLSTDEHRLNLSPRPKNA